MLTVRRPIVSAALHLAKGTAGVKLTGKAERAMVAKPNTSGALGVAGSEVETPL